MSELGLKSGLIVKRNEARRIEVEDGEIKIKAIWMFLLELREGWSDVVRW